MTTFLLAYAIVWTGMLLYAGRIDRRQVRLAARWEVAATPLEFRLQAAQPLQSETARS